MKKFNSVEDMFNDIHDNADWWHKFITKPSMNWLRWLIYNAKDVPFDFYRKCKRGWQRAYFGICDEDVWSFDYHLTKIILRGLKRLREKKCGCPWIEGFNDDTEENWAAMQKEWDLILNSMIWTFEITEKIQVDNWLLLPEKGFTEKEMVTLSRNFHVMTVEEMNRYKEGWSNFTRYYYSLWD